MTVFSKIVQGMAHYQDADLDPNDTMEHPVTGQVMKKLVGASHLMLEAPAWHLLLPDKGALRTVSDVWSTAVVAHCYCLCRCESVNTTCPSYPLHHHLPH